MENTKLKSNAVNKKMETIYLLLRDEEKMDEVEREKLLIRLDNINRYKST